MVVWCGLCPFTVGKLAEPHRRVVLIGEAKLALALGPSNRKNRRLQKQPARLDNVDSLLLPTNTI